MQKLLFYFIIILLSILASLGANADTTVYFFEHRRPNGQIDSFDLGGRFYHAALKYHDQILEAHPYYGAHLTSDLDQVGHLVAILHSQKTVKNFDAKVQAQLGKPFNLYSAWDDQNSTQCSKLIGQIIGVSPVPVQDGSLSLSPDTLYRELKKRGFKDIPLPLPQP
ncbi:MAG: hypothetical protein H7235_09350 [Bdellovibrionaceae bacterium]|nr:hypothetical protein [Pseudobdellovibrionaceae bacterium]